MILIKDYEISQFYAIVHKVVTWVSFSFFKIILFHYKKEKKPVFFSFFSTSPLSLSLFLPSLSSRREKERKERDI